MRISTSMMYREGTQGLQNRQSDLYRVQNQLSTGRRVLSPQDDPIAASEALKVSQSKGVNQQYLDNQVAADSSLTYVESTIASAGDLLTRALELAASVDSSGQTEILPELQTITTSLLGLANTQDGTGLYIFGGYQSKNPPFQLNTASSSPYSLSGGTYVQYNGDAGNPTLQVSSSSEMAVGENGIDVFMQVKDSSGNVVGRSMFDSLKNLADIVDPTSGVPFSASALNQAVTDLKNTISHVASLRASVGARLNTLDSLTSTGQDAGYQYDTQLSKLQDLDYTEAISRFSNYQQQLEAAQLSFKQISQLSLFNIL